MSWIEQLYHTYESCSMTEGGATTDTLKLKSFSPLAPPFHTLKKSDIEIILNGDGDFISAEPITNKGEKEIIIPCTEASAARTSGEAPHPLCEKIQYCAKDYSGKKRSYYNSYYSQLEKWASSEYTHPMVNAVFQYVKKGKLVEDLITTGKQIFNEGEDSGDIFVRWKVEIPGENETRCWKNRMLFESWKHFSEQQETVDDICMVTGEIHPIAVNHPKRIRNSADGAKLISSNDESGFTFKGRFLTASQSATVSAEVSQKAHSALRWLINRQSFRNGDQVIVSWAVSGKEIPDLFADTLSIFDESDEIKIQEISQPIVGDVGQMFARKLNKKIAGYQADLNDSTNIVVMGLDSAGPGRVSITFYRELAVSGFFDRIKQWHEQMAWHFNESCEIKSEKKKKKIYGNRVFAPSPIIIANACYGKRLDDKLKKSTIERLLPCIIDGRQIPIDLVDSALKRASNKCGMDYWEWARTLSVACSLFRCHSIRSLNINHFKNEYTMALEHERTDRDYLYGRLLAIAEQIEEAALYAANEKRETSAARLMQRFADYPFSTWRNIESQLVPYKSRLQANRPGTLFKMKNLLDEIHAKFQPGDFEKDSRLSGAYLLGYHCQRLD
ncbi:MAG: type I-C CRISPR-associated protein Cas8c/Csd1, partial [Bacteroidota bacterium]